MTIPVYDTLFYLQTATLDQPFRYIFWVAAQAKGEQGVSNHILIQPLGFSLINMVLDHKDDGHFVEYVICQVYLILSVWIKVGDIMDLFKFYKNLLMSFA